MADFIEFKRVEIGPENLTARVVIGKDAPLYTSEDLEGTTRVYHLLPGIIDHVCLGDAGETFKDVMGDTEVAHLLEHVTVELLAQTNIAGDITSGRTKAVPDEEDTYDIQLSCPDDVLVVGALSSAAWILQWAYTDGSEPAPDIEAIVSGLVSLVESLPTPNPVEYEEADEPEDDGAETDGIEIPDFIQKAAEKRVIEEPRRSPEAVQSAEDDLDADDEVLGDAYVFDGYVEPFEGQEPAEEGPVEEPEEAAEDEEGDVDELPVEAEDAAAEGADADVAGGLEDVPADDGPEVVEDDKPEEDEVASPEGSEPAEPEPERADPEPEESEDSEPAPAPEDAASAPEPAEDAPAPAQPAVGEQAVLPWDDGPADPVAAEDPADAGAPAPASDDASGEDGPAAGNDGIDDGGEEPEAGENIPAPHPVR